MCSSFRYAHAFLLPFYVKSTPCAEEICADESREMKKTELYSISARDDVRSKAIQLTISYSDRPPQSLSDNETTNTWGYTSRPRPRKIDLFRLSRVRMGDREGGRRSRASKRTERKRNATFGVCLLLSSFVTFAQRPSAPSPLPVFLSAVALSFPKKKGRQKNSKR